ncbi:MAG: hypothetical protein ABIS59_00675 [Candidatus Saccharibacteria bacterium]
MATQYVAGVCNINKAEIQSRRNVGHVSLVISLALIALLAYAHAGISPWLGLVTALPLWVTATGYMQAQAKFCVGHGMAGTQLADDSMKTFAQVSNAKDAAKDKAKARTMNMQAMSLGLAGGIVVAIALYLAS